MIVQVVRKIFLKIQGRAFFFPPVSTNRVKCKYYQRIQFEFQIGCKHKIRLEFNLRLVFNYMQTYANVKKSMLLKKTVTPRKKCPYSELFQSVSSRIQTEYGEIRSIFPYSVGMRKNTDQNNSKYGHYLRSVMVLLKYLLLVCNSENANLLNFPSQRFEKVKQNIFLTCLRYIWIIFWKFFA